MKVAIVRHFATRLIGVAFDPHWWIDFGIGGRWRVRFTWGE